MTSKTHKTRQQLEEMVMTKLRDYPELSNVQSVVVIVRPRPWDIAVVRNGTDAFGGWGKLREIVDHFRWQHDLVDEQSIAHRSGYSSPTAITLSTTASIEISKSLAF